MHEQRTHAIESVAQGPIAIVRLVGDHYYFSNEDLQTALHNCVSKNFKRVLIDLSQAKSINSLAIGTILGFKHQIKKEKGNLCLVQPPCQITNILKLTRTLEHLTIFDDMNEAIKYLS